MIGRRDRRIWIQDETCEPFNFESSVGIGNRDLGRFRIRSKTLGVIAEVTTWLPGAGSKTENAIHILQGEDAPTAINPVDRELYLSGALADVIETGGAGSGNVPGLTGTGTPVTRTVRIVLASGSYRVVYPNASGAALVMFHGWIFPDAAL